MGFGEAIATCFSKYVDFSGRARRSEYWYWTLFAVIVSWVATFIDYGLGTSFLVQVILGAALLLPGIAVAVRRLHDTGRSGWWLLLYLVIFVGWIVLLVWYCKDSEPGSNDYGPSPKVKGYSGPASYTPM